MISALSIARGQDARVDGVDGTELAGRHQPVAQRRDLGPPSVREALAGVVARDEPLLLSDGFAVADEDEAGLGSGHAPDLADRARSTGITGSAHRRMGTRATVGRCTSTAGSQRAPPEWTLYEQERVQDRRPPGRLRRPPHGDRLVLRHRRPVHRARDRARVRRRVVLVQRQARRQGRRRPAGHRAAEAPQLYAIVRDLTERARHADAGDLHLARPRSRTRSRPAAGPNHAGGGRDPGSPAGRRPGRAARRAGARAEPREATATSSSVRSPRPLAMGITFLARMAMWGAMFGGGGGDRDATATSSGCSPW